MSDWDEVAIDDIAAPTDNALATGPFGSSISARFFVDSGMPVIRGSNLSEDVGVRLRDEGLVYLTPMKAAEFVRSTVHRGDLVFTCWGTVNQIGLIDDRADHEEYVISNKQMKLTPDPTKADSLFLYYVFSSPHMQRAIKSEAIGSSVPGFNLGQLRAIRIRLPGLPEQRAIAGVLGRLDDKIELNRIMNRTLHELAQAILGRTLEANGTIGCMHDLAYLSRDGVDPAVLGSSLVEHYSLPAYDDGQRPAIERADAIKSTKLRVPQDSVLVSKLNPHIPRVWLPSPSVDMDAIASTEWLVLRPKEAGLRSLLYALCASGPMSRELASRVTGTTGSHQRVRSEDFLQIEMRIPGRDDQAMLARELDPLFARSASNLRESETLGRIRDLLLPKLISGDTTVRAGERLVEEAV